MLTFRLLVFLGVSCLLRLTAAQVPPQCGINCVMEVSQQPAFSNKTQPELCVNVAYAQLLGGCVWQECSVIELLSMLNFTRTACGQPAADNRHQVRVVTLTMFALATVFFSIRMVVKYLRYTKWGADDTWITVGYALLIPFVSLAQLEIPQGLGLQIWVLNEDQITSFLKLLFAIQECYILNIAIIKASILAFFLRIFPDHRFKRIVWCTLAVDLLLGILCFVLGIVQRQPTWLIWEGWKDKEPRGIVLDLNNLGLAHGGANVVLDVWMLVLPFTQLYKLNHPLHKKIGIFAMFSVGIFLTVVGAIRVHNLSKYATSQNITNDALEGIVWSFIEVCVGVVVACMPHTRQLFREATRKVRHAAPPAASIERTGRWRQPRGRRDSIESGTAVGSPDDAPAPGDKSWYSSMTQSAYTTTTCTSDRQPSSFASEATTRLGSVGVGQALDENAAAKLKTPEEKLAGQY